MESLADISLETAFAVGTQCKQDKQHKIDIPNANPTLMLAIFHTIFHWLVLGVALGITKARCPYYAQHKEVMHNFGHCIRSARHFGYVWKALYKVGLHINFLIY